MRVLIKQPGETWRVTDVRNTVEGLQEAVGGYFEPIRMAEDLMLIVDEEARLNGKHKNMPINGVMIYGTMVLTGVDGEEFADVPRYAERGLARK